MTPTKNRSRRDLLFYAGSLGLLAALPTSMVSRKKALNVKVVYTAPQGMDIGDFMVAAWPNGQLQLQIEGQMKQEGLLISGANQLRYSEIEFQRTFADEKSFEIWCERMLQANPHAVNVTREMGVVRNYTKSWA